MSLILASRATVYDRYAISRKFTAQETAINVIQGNISLLISASEIEELKNGDKTMYSKLSAVEMDLNSINLAVSSSEYKDINGVLSAITQAKASIELNSQEIQLKVSKDSLISTINQSAESVTINANKINLNGIVTANQNFKILADGSMEAKNGKFLGSVTVGGIQDDRISILNASGAQIGRWDNSGIYAENCEFKYATIGSENFQVDFNSGRMTLYSEYNGIKEWYAKIYQSGVVSGTGYLGLAIVAKHINLSVEHYRNGSTSNFSVLKSTWDYSKNVGEIILGTNLDTINVEVRGNFMVTGTTRQNGDMYIVGNLYVNGKQIN